MSRFEFLVSNSNSIQFNLQLLYADYWIQIFAPPWFIHKFSHDSAIMTELKWFSSVRLRISRCGRCTPRVKRRFRALTSPSHNVHAHIKNIGIIISYHIQNISFFITQSPHQIVCRKTDKVFLRKNTVILVLFTSLKNVLHVE